MHTEKPLNVICGSLSRNCSYFMRRWIWSTTHFSVRCSCVLHASSVLKPGHTGLKHAWRCGDRCIHARSVKRLYTSRLNVLAFFINFSSFKPDIENNVNEFWRCIKQMWQLWHRSVNKTKFWSLYQCTGYNARQFITEFRFRTKEAAGEVRNSRQASGQRQTQCAYWWKRRHSWVAVAESGRQTTEPPNSLRNLTWGGGSIDHQFCGLFTKICVSSCCKKKAHSTADRETACTRYFRYAVWETTTWWQANLHENWYMQTLF